MSLFCVKFVKEFNFYNFLYPQCLIYYHFLRKKCITYYTIKFNLLLLKTSELNFSIMK